MGVTARVTSPWGRILREVSEDVRLKNGRNGGQERSRIAGLKERSTKPWPPYDPGGGPAHSARYPSRENPRHHQNAIFCVALENPKGSL